MTTQAQLSRIVRPYLAGRDDLARVGRWIVATPVDHLLRFVLLGGTSHKARFAPVFGFWPMFEPFAIIPISYTYPLSNTAFWWDSEDEDAPAKFAESVERVALLALRDVRTIDDFMAFASRKHFPGAALQGASSLLAVIEAARGRFAEALAVCEELSERFGYKVTPERTDPLHHVLLDLYPLLKAGDAPAIADLLRSWERWKAEKLKLDKLWMPTPFPFEETASERPSASST